MKCSWCGKNSVKSFCNASCRDKFRYHNNINNCRTKALKRAKVASVLKKKRFDYLMGLSPDRLREELEE